MSDPGIEPGDPSREWMEALLIFGADHNRELDSGSERGLVLVQASNMDYLLAKILQKHLLNDTKLWKRISDGNGVLASFSNKILLCRMLGIIDQDEYYCLDALRNVRNTFAHKMGASFQDTSVRTVVRNVYERMKASENVPTQDAKLQLIFGCASLMMRLMRRGKQASLMPRLDPPEATGSSWEADW